MSKILIVYYSRTGITRKVAEALAIKINATVEEIKDTFDRSGAKGYLLAGRDATFKNLTMLETSHVKPQDFDLVIVGTPVWSWTMSVAIRTYLTEQKSKFKKVAFFCTMGSNGDKRTFIEMTGIVNQLPIATMALKTKQVFTDNYENEIQQFVNELNILE